LIEVCLATIGDAPALGATHAASWRVVYASLGQDFLASIDDGERAALFEKIIGDTATHGPVFVAVAEGAVAGFVNARPSRDQEAPRGTGEVVSIYTRPQAWGTGAGRALMERAVDELTAMGFTEATLWVMDTNVRARRFYEIAGWSTDGGEKDELFRGAPIHEVRYRRSLL